MTDDPIPEPVRYRVSLRCSPAHAFETFTGAAMTWWPTASHSVGGDRVVDVRFAPGVGGRIFEVLDDGTEHDWAELVEWDPPRGFRAQWHPGFPVGMAATDLTVRFLAGDTAEECVLDLVHGAFELLGPGGSMARDGYGVGWPIVLADLVAAVASPASA